MGGQTIPESRARRVPPEELTKWHNKQFLKIEVLLRATILDGSLEELHAHYKQAMDLANEALIVAIENKRWDLEACSQLYRGHIFRGIGDWKGAHECYVRSAPICHNVGKLTGAMLAEIERERRAKAAEDEAAVAHREAASAVTRIMGHCVRDCHGLTVEVLEAPPPLRSVRGKRFGSVRDDERFLL